MKTGNTLAVIYPTPDGKQYPGTDFCTLMAYMSAVGIDYRLLTPLITESHGDIREKISNLSGIKAVSNIKTGPR